MEYLQYIWGPVLGAIIGYATNYIAVKMLFRPYKPWKIGKWTLPFTPGIVPKRKAALARAIGDAVGHHLFTGDDLKDLLLSGETKTRVVETAMDALDLSLAFHPSEDGHLQTADDLALTYLSPELWGKSKGKIVKVLSERILAAAKDMEVGQLIAERAKEVLLEKKGSLGLLSMVVSENTLNALLPVFAEKVDAYIAENGKSMIDRAVIKQLDDYTSRPLHDIMDYTDEEQLRSIITVAYEKLIAGIGTRFNEFLDIASVVQKKVDAMDARELEALCMQVMKKELTAVINLGALIGFILGIFNLLV